MPETRYPIFMEGDHRLLMKGMTIESQYAMEKIAQASETLLMLSQYVGNAETALVETIMASPPTTTSKKACYVHKNNLAVKSFNAAQISRISKLNEKIAQVRAARWQADLDLLRLVKAAIQGDPEVFADNGPVSVNIPSELRYP